MEERLGTSVRLDDGKVEEVTTGLDRGAGVRVGHGTSFGYAYSNRLDRETLAPSNAALVKQAVACCAEYGRRPATVAEARAILSLPPA